MNNQKNKDLLLLIPPNTESLKEIGSLKFKDNSTPPLALGNLSAFLEERGIKTEVVDYRLQNIDYMDETETISYTKSLIETHNPKIMGVSAVTHVWPKAALIARTIKENYPHIKVIAGGIHPTFMADNCLRGGCDIVVRGEGEETLFEVSQNVLAERPFDLESVLGISFLDSKKRIVQTPNRPLIQNLDALPFIDREKINAGAYAHPGAIISARGCPYTCNFCSCGAMSGHTYRARSAKNVLLEVKKILETYPSLNEITFLDDTLPVDSRRLLEICEGLKNRGLEWSALTRADTLPSEVARAMTGSGCTTLQIGIESGSDRILKSISKGITIKDAEDAVRTAREAGFKYIICGFMIGHPEDTEETVYETIGFAHHLIKKYGVNRASFSIVTPLPGTDLWRDAARKGITIYGKDDWADKAFSVPNISTQYLGREEIGKLQGIAIASTLQLQKELGV